LPPLVTNHVLEKLVFKTNLLEPESTVTDVDQSADVLKDTIQLDTTVLSATKEKLLIHQTTKDVSELFVK